MKTTLTNSQNVAVYLIGTAGGVVSLDSDGSYKHSSSMWVMPSTIVALDKKGMIKRVERGMIELTDRGKHAYTLTQRSVVHVPEEANK